MTARGDKKQVLLLWQRFGHYHHARMQGAQEALQEKGWTVAGLGVAGRDHYDWDTKGEKVEKVHTLFSHKVYGDLERFEIGRAIRESLDRLDPAAIAVNGWAAPEALAAKRWCVNRKRPAVLMSETHEPSGNWWKEVVKRRRVSSFKAALVGGDRQRVYLKTLGFPSDRIFLGYDVVDNEFFSKGAERARKVEENTRRRLHLPHRFFLANTRFIARKNIDGLLRAFALYRKNREDEEAWDLVISGSGEKEKEWKELAVKLRVAESVQWPGFVQYPDLPTYYGLAGAFIHPALREAWGLVVNEAAAAGLPLIIGERVGAASELVRNGENGYLVQPNDIESMARAMGKIAGMDDAARGVLGARSRRIVAEYGPERFGRGLAKALSME